MIVLDEDAILVLSVMKANQRPLELPDLCDLSGLDEDSVMGALDQLREVGFVAPITLGAYDS